MSKVSNSEEEKFQGNTNRKGEGQLYDKIMRENLLELFLPLVAEKLNFVPQKVSPLPDKQPTTVIRETDAFLLIETASKVEPKFILHLEFESKDDDEMIYRIMEYHGIELRKYRLPIKHVVVYLGEKNPKMRTKLNKSEVFEGFTLVNTHSFSPQKWLEQKEPSKIIMAILGDYQKQNAEIILKAIVSKLKRVCRTETELKKFIEQLIIISRMRNLEELTIKISKAMPITIDIEKDYLYKLGLKQAEKQLKAAEAKAKIEAQKAKIEAQKAKAEAEKAKVEAQKAKTEAAKAKVAKAEMEKLAQEKADLEEKNKTDKKIAIQKMMSTERFSNQEIMELLNLQEELFKQYLNEIEKTKKLDQSKPKDQSSK